jgi:GNAT superfamily N-acetyltransferase
MNSKTLKEPEVSLFKKIQVKVHYGLTLQSLRNLFLRMGIDLSPYYLFQEGINFTDIPEIKDFYTDYSCELLKAEDMKTVGAINYAGYTEDKLLKLLEAGEQCIGIKHDDEIVAFMWINFNEINYKSTIIPLHGDEAYLWFMYTRESYRGKNLAPFLRYKSYKMLKEMGRNKLYSISDYFNSPAVIFKKKLNAKKLKLIFFVQLFKKLPKSFTLKLYKD